MPGTEIPLPFERTFDLFALASLLAAGAVTVHVLLRKRDVRSAIGWIGLAWLSPIAGPLLYYLFGINRVTRHAARLGPGIPGQDLASGEDGTPDDARLPENIRTIAEVGGRLTGRPLAAGNKVLLLGGGDDAYPAMLDAIAAARRSIALASYIFRADRAGSVFVAALAQARRRGVEIRVLVDGIGSGYFRSSALRALDRSGVAGARFMHDWLPWRMPFLNMRNHKKLLIVDGAQGFVGGLNLGAENLLRRWRRRDSVEDVHFRIDGPVVAQLMRSFAEDWSFTTGEVLSGDAWWPEIPPQGVAIARGISSGPDEDMGKLEALLAAAVSAAKRRLRIVTPYFLPDHRLMAFILLAALRGVEVEIVLPERSDHLLLDWAMRGHLGFFAIPGITVHLTPAPFDHSKLATVDGLWSAFGSPNWDVRSLRLNFELMLECYDPAIAGAIDSFIDGKIARARPLPAQDLAARPLPVVLRDAAARLFLPYL